MIFFCSTVRAWSPDSIPPRRLSSPRSILRSCADQVGELPACFCQAAAEKSNNSGVAQSLVLFFVARSFSEKKQTEIFIYLLHLFYQ